MSNLSISEIGTVVASITGDADNQVVVLEKCSEAAGKMAVLFNKLVEGTTRTQLSNEVVQSFVAAQKAIDIASQMLSAASQAGNDWLDANIGNAPSIGSKTLTR